MQHAFKALALPWLLQQKLTDDQRQSVLNGFASKLVLLAGSGDEDAEDKVLLLIRADLASQKANNQRFGHRSIHALLTLRQLNKLKRMHPALLKIPAFVQTLLQKLMPQALATKYTGKRWDDVPMELKAQCLDTLYEFAHGPDLDVLDEAGANSIRCFISFQRLLLSEPQYELAA